MPFGASGVAPAAGCVSGVGVVSIVGSNAALGEASGCGDFAVLGEAPGEGEGVGAARRVIATNAAFAEFGDHEIASGKCTAIESDDIFLSSLPSGA